MSLTLPEGYVGISGDNKPEIVEHAEQVQRNFETIGAQWPSDGAPVFVGSGGSAPAFQNGWVNFGGGQVDLSYYAGDGRVWLSGIIKSGALNTIFTLPVGLRPAAGPLRFPVFANFAFGSVHVFSTGEVQASAGSNAAFDLSSVNFKVG